MNHVKSLIKDWLPPVVLRTVKGFRNGGVKFEGSYTSWEAAAAQCSGYDAEPILAKVLDATLKVKRGEAAYERDSVLFDELEYDWPVVAGLMWAAAQSGGNLSVLDFGGALGSSYFQNRAFLADLQTLRWSVIEQEHYAVAGRNHLQDDTLRFYTSIDECLRDNKPNLILLSSVLQYLPDADRIIEDICRIGAQTILIDKTIVNHAQQHSIHVQRVPATIYEATYPCQSLSEKKLLGAFSSNYQLVSQFPSLAFSALDAIDSKFNGYIFTKVRK